MPVDYLQPSLAEDLCREVFAVCLEPGQQLGDDAGPAEGTQHVALVVDACLIKDTNILNLDLVAGKPRDLGDMRDGAATIAQAGLLHEQCDAAYDLLANRLEGQV